MQSTLWISSMASFEGLAEIAEGNMNLDTEILTLSPWLFSGLKYISEA